MFITFDWNSLKPNRDGEPPAALLQKIVASFESLDAYKKGHSGAVVSQ